MAVVAWVWIAAAPASATHVSFSFDPDNPQAYGNILQCNGWNHLSYPAYADFMLVSTICQFRNPYTGVWTNWGTRAATAWDCDDCSDVFNVDERFCSELPSQYHNRILRVRTRIDGYVRDNGHREDKAAATSIGTVYFKCP
jgi:hypothetical protein